jgi:hypothetical protein
MRRVRWARGGDRNLQRNFLHLWKADLAVGIRPYSISNCTGMRGYRRIVRRGIWTYRDLLVAATEQIPVPTAFSFLPLSTRVGA